MSRVQALLRGSRRGLVMSLVAIGCSQTQSEPQERVSKQTARLDATSVGPVLECVRQLVDGTYAARFGYHNDGTEPVVVLSGDKNRFVPAPANRGQPTRFEPGRHANVFEVEFDGSDLVWSLNGRTSTANRSSTTCFPEDAPTPEAPTTFEIPDTAAGRAVEAFMDAFLNTKDASDEAAKLAQYPGAEVAAVLTEVYDKYRFLSASRWLVLKTAKIHGGQEMLPIFLAAVHREIPANFDEASIDGHSPVFREEAPNIGAAIDGIVQLAQSSSSAEAELYNLFSHQLDFVKRAAIIKAVINAAGDKVKLATIEQQIPSQFRELLEARELDPRELPAPGPETDVTDEVDVPRPVLECVTRNADGSWTAHFGYLNGSPFELTVPVGATNQFTPAPMNRGQPSRFASGRRQFAFSVVFDGAPLVWSLAGRTSTASSSGKVCGGNQ